MHLLKCMAAAACVSTLVASAARAQATPRDTTPRQARENARNVRMFMDRSNSEAERLRAAEAAEGLNGVDQVTWAINLLRNPAELPRIRAAALLKAQNAVAVDANLQREIAELLGNRAEAPALREASMATVENLSFATPPSALAGGAMDDTLRSLLDDPDAALRLRAVTVLVNHHDEAARSRLVQGLQSPAEAAVAPADAVRLLGRDLQPDALPALRQVMASPPDQPTRIEAIRALGADLESRAAIAAILADRQEPEAVRLQAMASLNANAAPQEFAAYTRPIVTDEAAGDALRLYAILAEKDRRGDVAELPEDEFDQAVRALATSSTSQAVRDAAAEYLRSRRLAQT
ncbi:MAG TPA: HEAT repeat domain-containing protein [Longimicrobium sp.]|jgi:hypothetical protein|nr:HEAT repeat domain-containing protein [Longimicrobium sp.]